MKTYTIIIVYSCRHFFHVRKNNEFNQLLLPCRRRRKFGRLGKGLTARKSRFRRLRRTRNIVIIINIGNWLPGDTGRVWLFFPEVLTHACRTATGRRPYGSTETIFRRNFSSIFFPFFFSFPCRARPRRSLRCTHDSGIYKTPYTYAFVSCR